jgi:hypothetical protein
MFEANEELNIHMPIGVSREINFEKFGLLR